MDPAQMKTTLEDPRFREEPRNNETAEVARDRMVLPDTMTEEAALLAEKTAKANKIVAENFEKSIKNYKLRRNGPCLCGSDLKFKKCCMLKIREGKLPAVTLSQRKQPHTVTVAPTRKLRNALRKRKPETPQETTGQEDREEPDTPKDARGLRYTYPKDPTR